MRTQGSPYRVGFTGTARVQVTREQVRALYGYMVTLRVQHPEGIEWHHGGAREGDAKAHLIATAIGFRTVVHPGPRSDPRDFPYANVVLPQRDNLDRNEDIVRVTRELVAAPRSQRELRRSGTWTTVRRAVRSGRPVTLILPDGTVTADIFGYMTTVLRYHTAYSSVGEQGYSPTVRPLPPVYLG